METIRNEHLTEAEIEEYALGRLPRESASGVLSHLMNCDECADLLEQEQNFRQIFRAASEEAAQPQPAKPARAWSRWTAFPAPAMVAVAALGLIILFVPTFNRVDTSAQTVSLSAYRGGDSVEAKASAHLTLQLDATGLETNGARDVRIVDANGREVWHSTSTADGNRWVVNVDRRLDPGLYWVRLFREGDTSTPEREFRLDVR